MLLLEYNHGPEAISTLTTSTDVDTFLLSLLDDRIMPWAVKGKECPAALATKVEDLVRVSGTDPFNAATEALADLGGIPNWLISSYMARKIKEWDWSRVQVLNCLYGMFGRRRLSRK